LDSRPNLAESADSPSGGKESALPPIIPACLSMIVANDVVLDRVTGQASILGIIHDLVAPGFPAARPRLVVWAELIGGHGAMPLLLATMRIDGSTGAEHVLTEVRLRARFDDPRRVLVVVVTIDDMPLAGTDDILFRLSCPQGTIMERRIRVMVDEEDPG